MTGTIEKSAKLSDVARAAGVSQGTVSNVFNRPALVREEVREHVHDIARKLGYRGPDPKGRLLRAGKVNAIGIAVAEPLAYFFNDPFARQLMTGISDACDSRGVGLALISILNEERLAWNVDTALVDGLILLCIEDGTRLVTLARERELPFVALQMVEDDTSFSAVGIDNAPAARLAARHITDLGHRNVAILSLHDSRYPDGYFADTRRRLDGYLAELREAEIDAGQVPVLPARNDPREVEAALDQLFAKPNPPTAILSMSDLMALTAVDWLKRHGRRVPEDVSVVGFDGIAEGARSKPRLTTVAQPIVEQGRRAVEILLTRPKSPVHELLDVRLIVRGSTAPPKRSA